MFWFILALVLVVIIAVIAFRQARVYLVAEDSVAVTVNRNGFIQRVLPAGRHRLGLFEKVDFALETKTRLASGQAVEVTTGEGIPVNVSWSGTYTLEPGLIKDKVSQRLRSLPGAERAIARNVDICLRKLVSSYSWQELFNPVNRDRLERQLGYLLADRLQPLGIVFNGLNLQTVDLPDEVAEALAKAKALEMLDGAIRRLDATTREVVRGAYQLDEILHWDAYLPVPSRLTMKRMQAG